MRRILCTLVCLVLNFSATKVWATELTDINQRPLELVFSILEHLTRDNDTKQIFVQTINIKENDTIFTEQKINLEHTDFEMSFYCESDEVENSAISLHYWYKVSTAIAEIKHGGQLKNAFKRKDGFGQGKPGKYLTDNTFRLGVKNNIATHTSTTESFQEGEEPKFFQIRTIWIEVRNQESIR